MSSSSTSSTSSLIQRLQERLEYLEWLEAEEQRLTLETTAQIAEYTSLELQLKDETRARDMRQMVMQQSLTRSFLT